MFLVPLLQAATTTPPDDLLGSSGLDVDRQLLHRFRDEIAPGRSALLLLGSPEWLDTASQLTVRDGERELFRTSLSAGQERAAISLAIPDMQPITLRNIRREESPAVLQSA
jgi:uncharacterized membrane protein